MLKNIALGIVLLAALWIAPVTAQTGRPDVTVVRTLAGVRYEVPAGWEWTEFDGYGVTIQHLATKSGEKGKEKSPNLFTVSTRTIPDDRFDSYWGNLDRNQRRTFPGGVLARWKAGIRWGMHYVFAGEITVGSKVLTVEILDPTTPRMDVNVVEAAFLRVAETIKDVPATAVIYHPSLRMAADQLDSSAWTNSFGSNDIAFRCQEVKEGCGDGSSAWLFTYHSTVVFADTGKALADITGYFEKNESLKIGAVQRAEVPGGEVLWTEQPGTKRPFLGAVRRDGRYFFVATEAPRPGTRSTDALRKDFLAVAKSVRTWDGN